ncbi:MAG: polyhydroxyalkanoate synthesis regulator DNA-binding domain-containing protein [Rhodothermales bacterium]
MARLIKRYGNRKLYDTVASAYVSLADIARLVRQGETVEVVDNATGNDLTAQMLTQIILEEGKRGKHTISTDVLHDLVRHSSEAIDSGFEQVKQSVDDLVQTSLGRVNQLLRGSKTSELSQLRDQLGQLEHLLNKVLDDREQGTPEEDAS